MSTKCAVDIKKDIINSVGKTIRKSGAYVEGEYGYFPNPRIATKQINIINYSFKDLVVKEDEQGSFHIDPPIKLINIYFEEYKKTNGLISKIAPIGLPEIEIELPKVSEIKPGVEELFDSNPELANAVYEAAGVSRESLLNIVGDSLGAKINSLSEKELLEYLKNNKSNIRFDFLEGIDKINNEKIFNLILNKGSVAKINKLISESKNLAINNKSLPKGLKFTNTGYTIITNATDFQGISFDTNGTVKIKSIINSDSFNGKNFSSNIIADNASEKFKINANKRSLKDVFKKISKYQSILNTGLAPKKNFEHTVLITSDSPLGYTLGLEGESWNIEIGADTEKFPDELYEKFRLAHVGNKQLTTEKPLGWIGGKIINNTLVITELQSDLLQNTFEIPKKISGVSKSSVENYFDGWEYVFLQTAINQMKEKYPNITYISLPSSKVYTSKVPKAINISKLYDKLSKEYNFSEVKVKKQELNIEVIPIRINNFESKKGFIITDKNGKTEKFTIELDKITSNKGYVKAIPFNKFSKIIIDKAKGNTWRVYNSEQSKQIIQSFIQSDPYFDKYQDNRYAGFNVIKLSELTKPITNNFTKEYYDVYIKTYLKSFVKEMKISNPDLASDFELAYDAIEFSKDDINLKQFYNSEYGIEYLEKLNEWIEKEFSKDVPTQDIKDDASDEGGILVDSEGNEIEDTYEETEIDRLVKKSNKKEINNDYTFKDQDYLLDELNKAIKEKNKIRQDVIKQILTEINTKGNSSIKYDNDGKIQGFIDNGDIFLNKDSENKTLIEEAAHLWLDQIKKNNSALYNEGLEKVKNSSYVQEVLNNSFYVKEALKLGDELSKEYQDYILEEALSKAIKDEGVKLTDENKKGFLEWLIKLYNALIKLTGLENKTIAEVKKMSLQEFSKESLYDIFNIKEKGKEVNQTFLQKKQQAQQLYSQYLDTIFPDSKVKDIVYHTNTRGRIESFNSERGLFVTPTLELAKTYKPGPNGKRFQLVIDSKNIDEVSEETIMDGKKQSGDTLMYSEPEYTEYVVFEPEQIHILGNKQDIEGFKEFVETPQKEIKTSQKTIKEETGLSQDVVITKKAKENFTLANTIYNIKPDIGSEQLKDIYENYLNLMDRKREGKGVDYKTFEDLIVKNLQVFNYNDSYIFGEWDGKNNVFKARFISSPSIRQLYVGLDILSSNVDVVASVPEDIGNMLLKKGYIKLDVDKFYDFKGEEMIKNLYFSRPEIIEKVFKKSIDNITKEDVNKYDKFFNYRALIGKLVDAYKNKKTDEIFSILKELGIYDYNAYKLSQKFKSGKISEDDIKGVINHIIKNSSINKVNINNQDLINNPKIYNELDTELNKTLATFLSKFGIKTEVLKTLQDELNTDSLGTVDILNKIVYVKENNLTDYPEQAGFMIAYMMQHNPLVTDIIAGMRKFEMFKSEDKIEMLKTVGELIAAELYKKTNTSLPSGLLEKIKSLIKQFFDLFTQQRLSRINRNIGIIADNVLLQNESIITASQFKPGAEGKVINKINLEDALKSDPFANTIVNKMSEYFILTGSVTLAEQGTVYRPNENQLHDLDWVSMYDTEETIKIFKELYPDSVDVRTIDDGKYNRTDTWLVPPDNHTIENLKLFGPTNKIVSYDIYNEEGDIVSTYNGQTDSHSGEVEAKLVDIFTYSDLELRKKDSKSIDYILPSGKTLKLSDWRVTFEAKLRYARLKDIWDYNRFIPSDNIFRQDPIDTETPSDGDVYYQTVESIKDKKEIDKKLRDKIVRFLEKIGVSIQSVDEIRDANGNKINVVAAASMLNKIIKVVDGYENLDTLPEEAAHFFVEMLGEGHPLYKEMYDQITNYKIYSETFNKYKNFAAYKNSDGTINIDKIKKEAIGKLIAEHIIKQEAGNESESKILNVVKWWQRLWNFIKSIFSKSQTNPFDEAATKILLQDTEDLSEKNLTQDQDQEYYSLFDPLGGLRQDQDKITLDNSTDPRTGQKRHIYYYDKQQAKGSVTSVYVDKWLKNLFKGLDYRTDLQKTVDLLKAEFGDIVHEQIQDIIKSYTNPDGTRAETQSSIKPKVDPITFKILDGYIKNILNQYPDPGTVFMSEVKIYDQKTKIAGSIDLLVVKPDGVVDIYDWKTQEVFKDQTDIKTYKEPMYRIQLDNYRKILEKQYGFTKFGKIRAIPIATQFNFRDGKPVSVRNIEIGNIDPTKIPDNKSYLLPVTLKTEKTGDAQLDLLIDKLYAIYDKIDKQRYSGEELFKKREELAQLRVAIRDLQLKGKINRLIDLGLVQYKKYLEKINSKTLSGKDIPEALSILNVFSTSSNMLYDMREEYAATIEPENKIALAEFENQTKRFQGMTSNVNKLISDIIIYRDNQSNELAEKNGIFNLLNPESPVGSVKGYFSALSKISQKSFRIFSKLLRTAQRVKEVKFDKTAEELSNLKKNFTEWASKKGISTSKGLEMILNIDEKGNWNGNFLRKYKKEFDTTYKKAIEDSDTKWLTKNLSFDLEKYEADEKKQIEYIKSVLYVSNEEENTKLINEKIKNWIDNHRVINKNNTINIKALYNKENLYTYLTPKEEWTTDKWKELNKSENTPLKEVYNYFQNLIKYSKKLGMLDKYTPTFIPSIANTKVDQLVFGNIKGFFSRKGFFENLEVDSGTKYTPEIDPTTGEVINRVPVYFTKDMGIQKDDGSVDYSKKSRDLFKVFGIWAAHMYNYEAMKSIEDDSLMLLETEKNKKSLVTDQFGNIVIENGEVKAKENNDRNAKLLEEFINYYLYDKTSGVIADKKIKIKEKEYSALKSTRAAMVFYSLKVLAVNLISGTANLVSGVSNVIFNAQKGKFYTKKNWIQSVGLAMGNKKAQKALVYLDILQEGQERKLVDDLSLSKAKRLFKTDNLFIIQRSTDKAVQYPVAVAMLRGHMLENGKIVDIEQFVKNKYNYNTTYYNLPSSERKELLKKINDEVETLQKEKSLFAIGELDKNGKFSIPGLEKDSVEMSDFRTKIKAVSKRILGNNTREDINNLRTGMLGTAFMQFRNWIPELAEDRFGGLQFDDELQTWTYGRFNQFFGDLFKRTGALAKAIATGLGDNAIQMAKDSYERMKAEAYEKGEEWTITETEFIDLYIGNIKSMLTELTFILMFAAAVLSITTGDDDDDTPSGVKAYLSRALKKYATEFSFWIDPTSLTSIVKSPIPAIGLADDFVRFIKNFSKEIFGFIPGLEEWKEEAKPAKYFFRMVPIAKEALLLFGAFDEDFRKDWGIRIDTGN